MYSDIPFYLSLLFIVGGLVALTWSADLFVEGAAAIARAFGVSPFVVGMVIIGFGTSAPELCVSAFSGATGHSDLSLGNAYGSDIFNIGMILGVAALIRPISVKPSVTWVATPLLLGISIFSCLLVGGGTFTRGDGILSLLVFAIVMPVYCWVEGKGKNYSNSQATDCSKENRACSSTRAWTSLMVGLMVLVGSSHILVWGAVDMARFFGVSELMIGLTIVAAGTSLPELASAVASARKGAHEFVLGNIIGSNIFNILAVVGIAGTITPFHHISPYVLSRDLPMMVGLTASIALFGVNWRHPKEGGVINRVEGALWIVAFLVYAILMIWQETR